MYIFIDSLRMKLTNIVKALKLIKPKQICLIEIPIELFEISTGQK